MSRNSSTLQSVRLDSVLTPDEFYSRDHKVDGESVFPGAGFLEIACIAGYVTSERKVATISDIVWAQPLGFRSGPRLVQTALRVIGDSIEYDITSSDDGDERLVHSEGRMRLRQQPAAAVASDRRLSIEELRQQHPERKDAAYYYGLFRNLGLDYGPTFQTLQECYTSGASALSRLQVAAELKAEFDRYILHPCVIDAAFQTIAGVLEGMEPGVPHLPFALDEVEIIRPIPQRCWAYARRSEVQRSGLRKFDIQLLSELGEALVMLTGLYLRPIVKAGVVPRDSQSDRVLQSS